jgi:2-keto-4-pentenoate hydratase/2-oxohepta-3-ene-1,7-dioic acid hydratase in catechol pathway
LLIGINYREHIAEIGKKVPDVPSLFMKPLTTLINPNENIIYPAVAKQVDYEGEMAIIIKDKIFNVTEEDALEHVLGVTPFNDVTERIMGYEQELLTYCKGFDTFACFGPVIDTGIDPDNTVVRTYLNGVKVQEGITKEMVFNCSQIVAYVSRCMTLFPGDIISTGTPVHVLPMKDGDRVEIEVEGIDRRLVNFVYDPKVH